MCPKCLKSSITLSRSNKVPNRSTVTAQTAVLVLEKTEEETNTGAT